MVKKIENLTTIALETECALEIINFEQAAVKRKMAAANLEVTSNKQKRQTQDLGSVNLERLDQVRGENDAVNEKKCKLAVKTKQGVSQLTELNRIEAISKPLLKKLYSERVSTLC